MLYEINKLLLSSIKACSELETTSFSKLLHTEIALVGSEELWILYLYLLNTAWMPDPGWTKPHHHLTTSTAPITSFHKWAQNTFIVDADAFQAQLATFMQIIYKHCMLIFQPLLKYPFSHWISFRYLLAKTEDLFLTNKTTQSFTQTEAPRHTHAA